MKLSPTSEELCVLRVEVRKLLNSGDVRNRLAEKLELAMPDVAGGTAPGRKKSALLRG